MSPLISTAKKGNVSNFFMYSLKTLTFKTIHKSSASSRINYINTQWRETSKVFCSAICFGNRNSEYTTVDMDSISVEIIRTFLMVCFLPYSSPNFMKRPQFFCKNPIFFSFLAHCKRTLALYAFGKILTRTHILMKMDPPVH